MKETTFLEPAQKIPKLLDIDVAVIGGGTAGTLAAISASRQGVRFAFESSMRYTSFIP